MRKITAIIGLLALSLGLLSGCGRDTGESGARVVVAGSTSVLPYVEVLVEAYHRGDAAGSVATQGGGSSMGIMAAREGAAAIGMSSRPLNDADREAYWSNELWSVEIAMDGLAIIVHPDNPVDNLTVDQIRRIYNGELTDWGDVGGTPGRVHLFAREEGSGTRGAFEELAMEDDFITPRAMVQNTNGSVRQSVAGDRNAIGFISLGLVNEHVKAVRIDGVEATAENVINETYGLFRPFLFVCNGAPTGEAEDFIDFVLSPAGAQILRDEGLITQAGGAE